MAADKAPKSNGLAGKVKSTAPASKIPKPTKPPASGRPSDKSAKGK